MIPPMRVILSIELSIQNVFGLLTAVAVALTPSQGVKTSAAVRLPFLQCDYATT